MAAAGERWPSGGVLPKAPVLGWRSFVPSRGPALPSIADLPHRAYTTSGRAALLAALRQLALPAGSPVLVPTYHCPTMVAPVLVAGLVPAFFPIGEDGLPLLDGIDAAVAARARVMIAAQYFGLPSSLASLRRWCDARGIVLVEDCAHSYFGQAGERPIGTWGDFATASLSKFFPVAEGGILVSAHRPLLPLGLQPSGLRSQLKAVLDVLEHSQGHGHLAGVSHMLAPLLWLKRRHSGAAHTGNSGDSGDAGTDAASMMAVCDMARVGQLPSVAALALHRWLPQAGIVARRRANYQALVHSLSTAAGARLLTPVLPDGAAPYVCPLLVEGPGRAQAVYARMRAAGLPVFRWDRIWPGTPSDPQDAGPVWSQQLIQFLCHQNLDVADLQGVARTTQALLRAH
ncbi:MAG: DegT/DnrJ/EryC1/StrS family aminotransferase [Rubrivivax sp.]|nr:DegT/DnrJ/EryC1/StrS family aminotransferase [Rubrivivax sp.]